MTYLKRCVMGHSHFIVSSYKTESDIKTPEQRENNTTLRLGRHPYHTSK